MAVQQDQEPVNRQFELDRNMDGKSLIFPPSSVFDLSIFCPTPYAVHVMGVCRCAALAVMTAADAP
jgi:hypothetical protein